MDKKPDKRKLMKAAINIEMALMQARKKPEPLSPKEQAFRAALGMRLKIK